MRKHEDISSRTSMPRDIRELLQGWNVIRRIKRHVGFNYSEPEWITHYGDDLRGRFEALPNGSYQISNPLAEGIRNFRFYQRDFNVPFPRGVIFFACVRIFGLKLSFDKLTFGIEWLPKGVRERSSGRLSTGEIIVRIVSAGETPLEIFSEDRG